MKYIVSWWLYVVLVQVSAVLPNGPIFSDFGPESDFFEQNGPELVRINTQKSGLGGNKQRQINNVLYLRDIDRS